MARKSRDEVGAELALSLTHPSPPAAPAEPSFDFEEIPPPEDTSAADARARAEHAAHVNGIAPAAPPEAARAASKTLQNGEMDFGELVYRLSQRIPPVRVRIGDVSGWSLVERLQAKAWLEGAGPMPLVMQPYIDHGARVAAAAAPPPATPSKPSAAAAPPPVKQDEIKFDASAYYQKGEPVPYYDVRTPDGYINNCSLANGESAALCQLCEGKCPDQAKFDLRGATEKAPPPLFTTANAGPGINPDFARIVETLFSVDAFKDYADLEANLEIGEERGDYRTLQTHLDKAEKRARRAHRLYLGSKLELAKWEQDANKVKSVMRGEASATLEAEKAAGERKKAITNPDVDAKMSEMFADEYASQAIMLVKLKATVDDMEHMTKRWDAKCVDLRTLLETLRK